jgi:geranylgeranyl pyrophosphate synthase
MQLSVLPLTLPRAVPAQPTRPPQANIPQTREERERIKQIVGRYVARTQPVLPLSLEDLRKNADQILAAAKLDPAYRDYIGVVFNSEASREALAAVPYERRLLLLPKCLRVEDKCPAPFDDFGLLCKQCGLCTIQDLQNEAERLGYAVLVAEGSALVMAIIQTGKIDAIVGVSCLSVLEKAFPYMESAAIPGVAIPLLQDDCKDTALDIDWLWDVVHVTSDDRTYRLDLDRLRDEVDSWFEPASLETLMGPADSESERIARGWLGKAGKRWRPFLVACAWRAFQDDADVPLPESLKKVAIAVECFHKASLVHDDIEDGDAFRYGEKTLHEQHGMPVALNVGDLLLGDGYRLLAEVDAPPAVRAALVRIAAAGHRTLCLGQGDELCWTRNPKPLAALDVLNIHRQKTAPAFEVALRLGAALAQADDDVHEVLSKFSEALGIAYQIRDDLEDLSGEGDDLAAVRPALPLAIAYERATGDEREVLERLWRRSADGFGESARVRAIIDRLKAADRCRGLLDSYKEEAVRSLAGLRNASLKGLLRRVVSKIFTVEVRGWCSEFEARNAADRPVGAEAAG